MPFSIFRLPTLRGPNIVAVLIGASMFSMFFFISLDLQDVLGHSAIQTGLCFLPIAFGIIASSGAGAQLVNRVGFKVPLIVELLATIAGLAWLAGAHSLRAAVTGGYDRAFLAGAGIALAGALVAAVVISAHDSRRHTEWAGAATKQ